MPTHLAQPCFLLRVGSDWGLISRHELRALLVGFLCPMDIVVEFAKIVIFALGGKKSNKTH